MRSSKTKANTIHFFSIYINNKIILFKGCAKVNGLAGIGRVEEGAFPGRTGNTVNLAG
jgi:hypothetical protein